MKKILVLLLVFNWCFVGFAQEKKVRFEMGVNYPLGLQSKGNEENHLGFYMSFARKFSDVPLSARLKLSYESYTVVQNQYANSPFNGRSLSLVPSVNYHFQLSPKVNAYTGLGVGLSVDNTGTGVFNAGHEYHLVVVPQIGVELFKHIHLSAQYNITHKDFSRLMLGVGYVF